MSRQLFPNRRTFNPILLIPTILLLATITLFYALARGEGCRQNFQDGAWMIYEIEPWTEQLGDRTYIIGTTWKFSNIFAPDILGWERSTIREPDRIVWQAWGPRHDPEAWWNALLIHGDWRACACAVNVISIIMAGEPVVVEAVLANPERDPNFPFLAIQGPFPLVPSHPITLPVPESESPALVIVPHPRHDIIQHPSPVDDIPIRIPPRPKKRA